MRRQDRGTPLRTPDAGHAQNLARTDASAPILRVRKPWRESGPSYMEFKGLCFNGTGLEP
jgi:hypothetical protein